MKKIRRITASFVVALTILAFGSVPAQASDFREAFCSIFSAQDCD